MSDDYSKYTGRRSPFSEDHGMQKVTVAHTMDRLVECAQKHDLTVVRVGMSEVLLLSGTATLGRVKIERKKGEHGTYCYRVDGKTVSRPATVIRHLLSCG